LRDILTTPNGFLIEAQNNSSVILIILPVKNTPFVFRLEQALVTKVREPVESFYYKPMLIRSDMVKKNSS